MWLRPIPVAQFSVVTPIRPPLELRDYQQDCISKVLTSLKTIKKPAVSLPTGSGKTVIFSTLIPQIKAQAGQGNKTLVLVNRKEIALQTVRTVKNMMPNLRVCMEMGQFSYEKDPDVDVCVASIHTIHKDARLQAFGPQEFKLVIVDEAHHSAAKSYLKTLSHFGIDQEDPKVYCVGVSATFFRKDKKSLEIFDKIVYHREPEEMINAGHLCNVQVSKYGFEIPEGFSTQKRSNNFLLSDTGRSLVVKIWQDRDFKSTVVFCISKAHVKVLAASFRDAGVDCRSLTGDDRPEYRRQVIESFRKRNFPVLLNCAILTEGTDIPCIDQIIFATPLGSPGLAMQMIGRGLRTYPGKDLCNIVFFTPMVKFNTTSALLPELRGLTIVKETESFVEAADPSKSTATTSGVPDLDSSIDGIDEEKSGDLRSAFQGGADQPTYNSQAWLRYNKSFYLSLPNSPGVSTKLLKIEPVKGQWKLYTIHRYPKAKLTQFGFKNTERYSGETLSDARDAAEKFLSENFYSALISGFFNPRSKWRQTVGTHAQLTALQRLGLDKVIPYLNKGQASALLSIKICSRVKLTDEKVNDSLKLGLDLREDSEPTEQPPTYETSARL